MKFNRKDYFTFINCYPHYDDNQIVNSFNSIKKEYEKYNKENSKEFSFKKEIFFQLKNIETRNKYNLFLNNNTSYKNKFMEFLLKEKNIIKTIKKNNFNYIDFNGNYYEKEIEFNFHNNEENKDKQNKNNVKTLFLFCDMYDFYFGAIKKIHYKVTRVCPECFGTNSSCKKCNGNKQIEINKIIYINVPKFSFDGQELILKNKGDQNIENYKYDDLKIILKNDNIEWKYDKIHKRFYYELFLKPKDMKNGGLFIIPFFNKKQLVIDMPPNLKNNQFYILEEKGLINKFGKKDDLFVKVQKENFSFFKKD